MTSRPTFHQREVLSRLDLILINQEIIMARQAEANAAMAALESKVDSQGAALQELGAAILNEIEQLKAAKAGGDGMSSTEVDEMITRMEAIGAKVDASAGTARTSTDALKADD